MADRTLKNPIIRNALLSWALSRMKPDGDPDEIREAIGDMDRSLTYDEVLAAIERATSVSYQPQSPFDPYRRIANQLNWQEMKPVQEEQIQREEMLANAEMLRRALQEGLISEEEARIYLRPPESREEVEQQQDRIAELELRLQQRERELEEARRRFEEERQRLEEERRRRETVNKIDDYIREKVAELHLTPEEVHRLHQEVNPSLSYNENIQLIDAFLAEIQREREAQEAQKQIQQARQQAQPPQAPPSPPPPPQPAQPTPEQVRVELSQMGSRRLRDLGTALLAKDVEQGLTPLEKEMLNAILRILEERGENVGRMIHERLIQGFRWSVRIYYGGEPTYSNFESREEAEELAERLRKAGVRAEVVPFRREYSQ
jgi:DNA repair exonuclease SbcCD ATPase subunit